MVFAPQEGTGLSPAFQRREHPMKLDLRQAAPRYSGSFDNQDGKSRRN
jgi:hypothetical protein